MAALNISRFMEKYLIGELAKLTPREDPHVIPFKKINSNQLTQ